MSEEIKDKLADVYVLMYEAFKGYEDRCYMSNKFFDIMQYHTLLPEDVFGKIKEFADENIRPMYRFSLKCFWQVLRSRQYRYY